MSCGGGAAKRWVDGLEGEGQWLSNLPVLPGLSGRGRLGGGVSSASGSVLHISACQVPGMGPVAKGCAAEELGQARSREDGADRQASQLHGGRQDG